jgi:hypothetical protein
MGDLSDRDVEDVLEGVQPPGRDDLAPVVELTTWLHASREIEPPPAMRDDLFTQIEAGLAPYHRSSRRAPAHLRHHGRGTRRSVRRALAGSGRPLVSVAAAAVLLVGVILAVRTGGPDREPSAFVTPSEQRGSAGADAPTTTGAPPTTAPPTDAAEPPGSSDPGLADDVPSTTDGGTRHGSSSSDVSSADRGSRRDDDATPPTTDWVNRGSEEDPSSAGRGKSSATSAPTDDSGWRRERLSGWDFDLSEWTSAEDLWDAADETGELRVAGEADGDANGDDDAEGRERRDVGERDHGAARDDVSDDDAGDDEPAEEPGDVPAG